MSSDRKYPEVHYDELPEEAQNYVNYYAEAYESLHGNLQEILEDVTYQMAEIGYEVEYCMCGSLIFYYLYCPDEFQKWLESDNVYPLPNGKYIEQVSQYRIEFTLEEIRIYYYKSFIKN